MTNLETNIKDVISKKLEEGVVEQLIAEQLELGIKNALKDLLGSYGAITKVIEAQIKSVMIPYLESYDYSKYIVKLDSVLVDVLQSSTLDNKELLENFKELMTPYEDKEIKATDLFNHWMKHVSKNIETDGLDIDYDEGVSYESVEVTYVFEEDEARSWSSIERGVILFECDHDESLNIEIPIHSWKDIDKGKWTIDYKGASNINSLRNLNTFEIFMMKLNQNYTKIVLDSTGESDYVTPDDEPEASFS